MLPTIKSDSIYPLPNDVAIFNINIVDIIFLIGIICLIIKRKSIFNTNNDVLDKHNSNKIKGLLAILIIIHHLSIYIKDTILFKVFTIAGVIAVSAFFFYSGYGLMTSYLKKENYLKDFLNKRIMKIVIPYIIAIIFTILAYLLTRQLSLRKIFNSLVEGEPVVRFSWYVLAIIILYVVFYLSAKFLKKKKMINIAVFGGTILYCIVVNNILGFNNWWVNSCFAFFIGIYWASYKEKYAITLKDKNKIIRYAIMLSIILFAIIGIQFLTSGYAIMDIINDTDLADDIMREPIPVINMNIICIALLFVLFTILEKMRLNDKVFTFLGNISFEIYLYHGLVMYLLRNPRFYCRVDYLYAILVIGLSIILAKLMNIANNKIYNFYLNKVEKESC